MPITTSQPVMSCYSTAPLKLHIKLDKSVFLQSFWKVKSHHSTFSVFHHFLLLFILKFTQYRLYLCSLLRK
ncbi:hypothetical protein BCV71DRAFT_108285 [Rhizopus microsporus]|uniref:Uncharacterized protein n=1 Tax=Rhizopus microsporus TaxID=58291 RepID=A0A1X0S4E0_RHIZD|nr:hypothetical protein BCV71DRAFT_108285 [Rhizopus microsporus]